MADDLPKTVYVIGAGAGKEINMPTGAELKEAISFLLDIRFEHRERTSGDEIAYYAIQAAAKEGNLNDCVSASRQISQNLHMAISIDNFIHNQREQTNAKQIEACGKIGIVKAILDAERNSSLYEKTEYSDISRANTREVEKTWYNLFFQILNENCTLEQLKLRLSSIALIIFNYDRCIEFFLLHAIKGYCNIDDATAYDIINGISIYHPYGSLGKLPRNRTDRTGVEFGADLGGDEVHQISKNIKTFTEGIDDKDSEITQIHKWVNDCDRLVFLGFAYHDLNMRLLAVRPVRDAQKGAKCFGTILGISDSDKLAIENQIHLSFPVRRNSPHKVNLKSCTCCVLFNEYRKSLGFPMP